jgi:serine/threonine-protein kinase RsbW
MRKPQRFKLRIPSMTDNLQLIRDFVIKIAAKTGFSEENQEQVALAVDEACTNVIKHAHKYNATQPIDILIQTDAAKIKITISDQGSGFDPSSLSKPDLKKLTKEASHGGLGIYLMQTLMDEVDYNFNPGIKNQVQLIKYRQKSATI